jgi:hypothetical protein
LAHEIVKRVWCGPAKRSIASPGASMRVCSTGGTHAAPGTLAKVDIAIPAPWCASRAASRLDTKVGSHQSSASRKVTKPPDAAASPALRAALSPALDWWMTMTLESRSANASHRSPLPSVDPSSTRMTSNKAWVCSRTESMHCSR